MNASAGSETGPRRQSTPARYFSVPTAKAVAEAATAFSEDPFAGDEALRNAIITAVSEAHAAGWDGAELITAIRAAVPAAAFFCVAHRAHLEAMIKRGQIELAHGREERDERVRTSYAAFNGTDHPQNDPAVQKMYLEAIKWAMGLVDGDATPRQH